MLKELCIPSPAFLYESHPKLGKQLLCEVHQYFRSEDKPLILANVLMHTAYHSTFETSNTSLFAQFPKLYCIAWPKLLVVRCLPGAKPILLQRGESFSYLFSDLKLSSLYFWPENIKAVQMNFFSTIGRFLVKGQFFFSYW